MDHRLPLLRLVLYVHGLLKNIRTRYSGAARCFALPPAHRQRSHARSPSRREFPPAALCLQRAVPEGAALATQCPDSCLMVGIESAKHDESVLARYRTVSCTARR